MSKPQINATHYDRIPVRPDGKPKKAVVNMVVETPKNSCQKFALNPEYGMIAFHSLLPKSLEWPYDYGFVPQTIAPDKDPLDLLIINEKGLFSGCLIQARVIDAIREAKDNTENDRLIGVPLPSPGAPLPTDAYKNITDVPAGDLYRIKQFLVDYSASQGHTINIKKVIGRKKALALIESANKKFVKKKPVPQ